jgi:hypothetical protein
VACRFAWQDEGALVFRFVALSEYLDSLLNIGFLPGIGISLCIRK